MKNADQASRRRRFRKPGGCLDSWDKFAGWMLLLAFVFGGTQVLPAQHSQDHRAASVHEEKSLTTPLHDDSVASGLERKHWSAEPACFEKSGDKPDRSVSRSWTLASPDGLYAAYAENEAVAERSPNGEITGCKSTSKLFVSGPGSTEAKVVLVIEPTESDSGNSIELIDWSRGGHRLLVIEFLWPWASDAGGIAARVYDANSGKMTGQDLSYGAFQRLLGRQCAVIIDPIGFSSDGKVVVNAGSDLDEEPKLEKDSCLKKNEIWSLDPATAKLQRLPDRFKVRRYGKRAP
jgi:hypothetical protein